MYRYLLIFCFSFLLIIVQSKSFFAQSSSGKATLTIKLMNLSSEKGGGIKLNLTLRNQSNSQIKVKESGSEAEFNYTIELLDSKKKTPPLTKKGKLFTSRPRIETSTFYLKLNKSDEIVREFDISKMFTLKAKEKYKVRIKKSIYLVDENRYKTLESEWIAIKT